MVKIVYCAKMEGSRARGRSKMRLLASVKASVGKKGVNIGVVFKIA
jgi:hypothetical protein